MPRAGLDRAVVVAAAADLADGLGLPALTMGLVADRLGVRAPSLYKHVTGQADLVRGVAALAADEAAAAVGAAIRGLAGRDALTAAARAFRDFVLAHPGRYAATIGLEPVGPDDPIAVSSTRVLDAFLAALRGYALPPETTTHALRLLRSLMHGFATLQAANGFQWGTDVDESFAWLIDFTDRGLRTFAGAADQQEAVSPPW